MNTRRTTRESVNAMFEKGFTLVELLIVVIILAILAAIVVPQFATTTNQAQNSSADSTLAGLRSAIDLYYQQHNNSYPGRWTAAPSAPCAGTPGAGVATGGAGITAARAFLDQLTLYTDATGGACSVSDTVNHRFGPYLKISDYPADPFLDVNVLEVLNTGDLAMGANPLPARPAPIGDGPGGFRYDSTSGKIIINLVLHEDR